MSQNRSSAVMQQRHEALDSLDDFPTPPWATRALCEELKARGQPLHLQPVWEPACNRMHMAGPLGEYFDRVHATDVHNYGDPRQDGVVDFLIDWGADAPDVDWVITNPPFRLGAEFIQRALRHARVGVAVFVRSAFVEGRDRYTDLFSHRPEAIVMPFVERVILWRGVLLDPEVRVWHAPKNGKPGELKCPASATAYSWLVWMHGSTLSEHCRIPPCRQLLTRPGDYPPVPDHLRAPKGSLL